MISQHDGHSTCAASIGRGHGPCHGGGRGPYHHTDRGRRAAYHGPARRTFAAG